jgi:polynucleotide 5'-kinase involved in rRNA processing
MVESINTQIKDLTISEVTEKKGSGLPTVLIVLGMAGSGKTTFVQVIITLACYIVIRD